MKNGWVSEWSGWSSLFINGCKKVLKYVHIANLKTLKTEGLEEVLKDIFVKIVKPLLVQKEDQINYKLL